MIWSLIRRKGMDAIVRSHERELMESIKILKGMDAAEIASTLLFAADLRNKHESLRDDLLDLAALCQERHKWVPFQLSQAVKQLQSQRDFGTAGALVIWLHTARAAQFPQVRYLAKEMWRELERGFPLMPSALMHIEENGLCLDVRRGQEFPAGLDPHDRLAPDANIVRHTGQAASRNRSRKIDFGDCAPLLQPSVPNP
jgi:hypothetical protein